MKILKSSILIILLVFVFDLLINLILPENIKKKIGTSRNYSLKSERFHHEIASKVNVNELWGNKKYKVKTNELAMRIGQNEDFKIDRDKEYIGFIGDSFVYGSGIDYKDHFITKLNINNYNFLNLGYVSYSSSIYFKKIEYFIKNKKINFRKIFIFIDHSDIQDEGLFYREDASGNIVKYWIDDQEVKSKNRKYIVKNYLKQNSFIFKLYENIAAPNITSSTERCLKKNNNVNYKEYIDLDRFGFSYLKNTNNRKWVDRGINKTKDYLDKIKLLSEKYNFKLVIVNYPSALEVIDNIKSENSMHFKFLSEWSNKNDVNLIDTRDDFILENNINDYLNNFISCDVHWNKNGHEIISKNIKLFLSE